VSDRNTTPIPNPTPTLPSPTAEPRPKSGLALAAMIVGIVAIIGAIIPGLSFVAFLPAIAALILGIIALVSKSAGRRKALTGVILGPIALIVAIGVSIATIVGGVGAQIAEPDQVPAPVAEPTDAPTPDAPPAAEEGTRANPAAAGSTIEISNASGPIWQIQIGAANLNAGDVIAAENQFNSPADPGFQYILVPVTYTYVGNESGTPWLDVTIEFVSAAGTTHSEAYVVAPGDYKDINEMYNGASATGNLVIMAPSADIDKGTWAISTFLSEPYFVKVG